MSDLIKNFPKLPPQVQQKILDGPAMAPPPGVLPNLNNPPNHNAMGITFGAICVAVASIAFIFRIYCQTRVLKKWRVEDSFGLLAFLSYVGAVTSYFLGIHSGGFLVNQWNIRFRAFQIVLQDALAITICYGIMTMFAKVAILLEWNRIFNPNGVHNSFFWASRIVLVVNILLYTSLTIAALFSCWPVHYLWEPWVEGHCINKRALDLSSAYFNLVADLFILLLPQRVIWTLQMSRQRKIGVSSIFSVGILTCLCAVGRIILIHPLKYAGDGDTNNQISKAFLLSIAEATLVILIFCMPAVPKGFRESFIGRSILYSLHSLASINFSRNVSRKGSSGSATPFENSRRYDSKIGESFGSNSKVHLNEIERQLSPKGTQGHSRSDRVILRRVDIESHHELANVDSQFALVSKQHPWAEGR